MKKIQNEMIKGFILSGIGLIFILFFLYKTVTNFILEQEIQKARLLAHTLVYTREYLAKYAPFIEFKNKKFHPFSLTPAYAVGKISVMLSKNENIYVKQTSDRYRNIDNKPNKFELNAIKYFQTHKNAKEFFAIHKPHLGINKEHLFYAYPLKVKRSCLKCHGPINTISKPLLAKLIKYYGNRAFGYKLGEIRGIVAINIPFQKIKNEIDFLFIKLAIFLVIIYILGIVVFMKINRSMKKDIDKINLYLENNLAKNRFIPFKEKLNFYEFDIIKNEINNTVKSIKSFQKELYRSFYYNALTRLPNRRRLLKLLQNQKLPLILLDIDGFKELNYYYGEEIADKLILEVAKRLKDIRVFHIKIDEFVIVKNKDITKEEIYTFTEKLIKKLEKPYIIDEYIIDIKFRAGISYSKKDFLSALSALDATKILNKDIVFCSEAEKIREKYKDHLVWFKKLKKAIEDDNIVPFFQPIMDRNKKVCKYECLVRLKDENGKIISPFFFLDIAKKSRLYFEITKIMIENSFEKFKDKNIGFSLNLTTLDLENEEIREYIISKIKDFPNKENISFEIVESEDIRDSKIALDFIKQIKRFGCKILIDDFGSGYANFDYLLKLGADGVKIDGSLIKNILEDKNSQIIVKTIISFAKEVNMQVIAEFVENKEIFEFLKNLGVDCFQGYYFSPPKEDLL